MLGIPSTVVHDGFCRVEILDAPEGQRTVVHSTDSVSVFVFDRTNRRVLLIRQRRYGAVRETNPSGMLVENVAGRFDVALGPRALAAKEAHEEAGITVAEGEVELINGGRAMAVSAGLFTEHAYLAYVEVDADRIEQTERVFGAEGEGEVIERIWIPLVDLPNYVCEDVRVFALINWFLLNRAPQVR